jgi:hypothetical protein
MIAASSLLKPDAAATIIGVSPKTLANLRCSGKGPAFYKVGGRVRYDTAELESWMRSRRYTSTSEATS